MSIAASDTEARTRDATFVEATIARCQANKGLAARLRRADNPATEYQCWEWLAKWNIDLDRQDRRLPYAAVAAAIARAEPESNGSLPLGCAIAMCYEEGSDSDQAKARLRRLLACDDVAEACRVLRPLLMLIGSRVSQSLDYACLLRDLSRFPFAADDVKAMWAQAFYRKPAEQESAP